MKFKLFFKDFFNKIKKANLPDSGAILAYNLLFSLFPFIIVLLNLVSFVATGYETKVLDLFTYLPEDAADAIAPVIERLLFSRSTGVMSLSLFIALLTGSRGVHKLMVEVNAAFGGSGFKNILYEIGFAFVLSLAMMVAIVLMLLTGPISTIVINVLGRIFGHTGFLDFAFDLVLRLAPYGFITLILMVIYRISAHGARVKFRYGLIASAFSTLMLFTITMAFSFYIDHFSSFNATYGYLGGIIVLLLWFYLTGIVIILGAYLASSLRDLDQGLVVDSLTGSED